MARAVWLQAAFWYKQGRLREARSEVLHAADAFEKIMATMGLEECRVLLCHIEEAMEKPSTSAKLHFAFLRLYSTLS